MIVLTGFKAAGLRPLAPILSNNPGIEVMSARALALFEKAGASVDHATQTVRLDRGLVAEALKTAPSAYALTPRNPSHAVHLGGDTINFTLVAGPPDQPAGSGLEALLTALAYFERPQRDADIMALAARGLAADAEARTEIELGKLRRGSPRHGHQPPPTVRPQSAKVPKKTLAFGAAVLAWFLVGVAATGLYVRRALTPSAAPAPTADTPAAEGGAAADASPSAGRGGVLSAASDVMDRAAKAGLRAIGIVPADNASPDPARVEVPKPAAPSRKDDMSPGPAEQRRPPGEVIDGGQVPSSAQMPQ